MDSALDSGMFLTRLRAGSDRRVSKERRIRAASMSGSVLPGRYDVRRIARPRPAAYGARGNPMTPSVSASERDLRALAGLVSAHRADLPAQGLPLSLLADLKDQGRCDVISFEGFDSERQETWFLQAIRGSDVVV